MAAHFPPARPCVAAESESRAGNVVICAISLPSSSPLFFPTTIGAQHRILPENTQLCLSIVPQRSHLTGVIQSDLLSNHQALIVLEVPRTL